MIRYIDTHDVCREELERARSELRHRATSRLSRADCAQLQLSIYQMDAHLRYTAMCQQLRMENERLRAQIEKLRLPPKKQGDLQAALVVAQDSIARFTGLIDGLEDKIDDIEVTRKEAARKIHQTPEDVATASSAYRQIRHLREQISALHQQRVSQKRVATRVSRQLRQWDEEPANKKMCL